MKTIDPFTSFILHYASNPNRVWDMLNTWFGIEFQPTHRGTFPNHMNLNLTSFLIRCRRKSKHKIRMMVVNVSISFTLSGKRMLNRFLVSIFPDGPQNGNKLEVNFGTRMKGSHLRIEISLNPCQMSQREEINFVMCIDMLVPDHSSLWTIS